MFSAYYKLTMKPAYITIIYYIHNVYITYIIYIILFTSYTYSIYIYTLYIDFIYKNCIRLHIYSNPCFFF